MPLTKTELEAVMKDIKKHGVYGMVPTYQIEKLLSRHLAPEAEVKRVRTCRVCKIRPAMTGISLCDICID